MTIKTFPHHVIVSFNLLNNRISSVLQVRLSVHVSQTRVNLMTEDSCNVKSIESNTYEDSTIRSVSVKKKKRRKKEANRKEIWKSRLMRFAFFACLYSVLLSFPFRSMPRRRNLFFFFFFTLPCLSSPLKKREKATLRNSIFYLFYFLSFFFDNLFSFFSFFSLFSLVLS